MTLRRTPSDFVVEETLRPGVAAEVRADAGPGVLQALYALTKTSLTTPQASAKLAAALGLRTADVVHAGLKDKHAVTTQHVTARVRNALAATELPAETAGDGWSARRLGFTAREASAAWIERNRFWITVRGLSEADAASMDERLRVLRGGDGAVTIPNYFGAQRFGSARHHRGFAARALIEGDFESALRLLIATPARKDTGPRRTFIRRAAQHWGDWARLARELPAIPERRSIERLAAGAGMRDAFSAMPYFTQQMSVEAYQSHLWNATVRRMVRECVTPERVLAADDNFGELLFPTGGSIPAAWRGCVMPMPAAGAALAVPYEEAMRAVLAEEGLSPERLKIPGLRRPAFEPADRSLMVIVAGLAMGAPLSDDLGRPGRLKRLVSFELPRGAYATVMLRALGQ